MSAPSPQQRRASGTVGGRRCSGCGTVLAADNTAHVCGKCHREQRDQLGKPPQLKDDFFETDDFRAAFASQHIGKVFKAYRMHPHHLRMYGKALNQELLGRWLGLNQAQVSKIETGKPEYNLETLRNYAKILHLPERLLWFDFPGRSRFRVLERTSPETNQLDLRPSRITETWQISPAIADLCGVLADYGFNAIQFGSLPPDRYPSIGNLESDLKVAFDAYQQSRFAIAAGRISTLLADAQVAFRGCQETDRTRVSRVLALAYQAAASVLGKVGQSDLAWIAAERGMAAAENADSPAIRGSLIRSVAFSLHSTGRYEPAMRLVESGAGYLESAISGDNAALSVYGTLFLVGSMAAARFGDGSKSADYLNEAGDAAQRLGGNANHLWTAFGPTNVAIHRVNTAVELGDFQTVLDSGLILNIDAVPTERRARYLLDVARTYSMIGNQEDALGAMITAERIAPEQVRQHYLSRKVVAALVRSSSGKPSIELDKLAKRVNVTEQI
ncbi:helix-turn-helix transcriptional regulator [Actinocrispum wychmicini]|uniref:DNA-binding XRE family transcriptional regulator n=1 Tax=Actinocrispum wychmicini TaxID=1213861 RepID=A0A4R2JH57_9PSEU|nr:XRE family transcriptional regulator [Actinocrispum wychmicini]TCO53505.1 DNA-binding XRE family transcriptional regulator [Actinocrispum wychmicini]